MFPNSVWVLRITKALALKQFSHAWPLEFYYIHVRLKIQSNISVLSSYSFVEHFFKIFWLSLIIVFTYFNYLGLFHSYLCLLFSETIVYFLKSKCYAALQKLAPIKIILQTWAFQTALPIYLVPLKNHNPLLLFSVRVRFLIYFTSILMLIFCYIGKNAKQLRKDYRQIFIQ